MSLPVSTYEDLLKRVRELGQEARQVQSIAIAPLISDAQLISNRSITNSIIVSEDLSSNAASSSETNLATKYNDSNLNNSKSKSFSANKIMDSSKKPDQKSVIHTSSPQNFENVQKEMTEENGQLAANTSLSSLYHGTWPVERGLWQSGPASLPSYVPSTSAPHRDITSVISFASSAGSGASSIDHNFSSTSSSYTANRRNAENLSPQSPTLPPPDLDTKTDIVYGLLTMLGASDENGAADMGQTLLALSSNPESCSAMRDSGCIPLLVQLIHSECCDENTREQATQALRNLVECERDEKVRKRELRVLKLLEQIRAYCFQVKNMPTPQSTKDSSDKGTEKHPGQIIANLMKLSFDEGHRLAICQLGGLQAIAQIIEIDHLIHDYNTEDQECITLRRYSGMALTNLTFGDGNNKALLCSLQTFMHALVKQLYSNSEDLKQVTASLLRNLSWRADTQSKQILRESGTVIGLAHAAQSSQKESTLKSILSALWNLSAHCSINKVDICAVPNFLAFLVGHLLNYKSTSTNQLAIVENAGGILRNISSHIALRDDYRAILREHNCLQILLQQLRSSSLTIVSNACGTLWNLSAKCAQDQRALWELDAVPMLRSLTHSKHKMISMGSSAALKNLLNFKPAEVTKVGGVTTSSHVLDARKKKAFERELNSQAKNLSETCENIENSTSPTSVTAGSSPNTQNNFLFQVKTSSRNVILSECHESSYSDSVYERLVRSLPTNKLSQKFLMKPATKLSLSDTLAKDPAKSHQSRSQEFNVQQFHTRFVDAQQSHDLNGRQFDRSQNFESRSQCDNGDSKSNELSVNKKLLPSTKTFKIPSKFTSSSSKSFSSIRNDFDQGDSTCDGPVDFSQKYNLATTSSSKSSNNVVLLKCAANKDPDNYGDDTVTDLDQPTNYSLRYTELEEEENHRLSKSLNSKTSALTIKTDDYDHCDTVKKYCTEDTPYESGTPLNILSLATSMSDLVRLEDDVTSSTNKKIDDNIEMKEKHLDDEKDVCSIPDVASNKYDEFDGASGITSPDKPVRYCEEGTPGGCFSRVSSLSSLNSTTNDNTTTTMFNDKKKKFDKINAIVECKVSSEDEKDKIIKEENSNKETTKVVSFGGINSINYAEETPLMFSRTSSLGSLDSVEQHSIHDDRSSVVSDFSRRTSGVVSPSELPDSPTQLMPPLMRSTAGNYSQQNLDDNNQTGAIPKYRRQNVPGQIRHPIRHHSDTTVFGNKFQTKRNLSSVFEDTVATFKDENTPIEFSRATSLSSLTIDDDLKNNVVLIKNEKEDQPESDKRSGDNNKCANNSIKTSATYPTEIEVPRTFYTEDTPALSHANSNSNLSELSIQSSTNSANCIVEQMKYLKLDNKTVNRSAEYLTDESGDDELLQQCIQVGMQKNSHQIVVATRQDQNECVTSDKDDIHSANYLTDESSNSGDELLLQQCIQVGMQKNSHQIIVATKQETEKRDESNKKEIPNSYLTDESNSGDELLLRQCIEAGMKKTTLNQSFKCDDRKERLVDYEDTSDENLSVTPADELLTQEELKRVDSKRVESDDSYNSADERLLQECIQAGMNRVCKIDQSGEENLKVDERKSDDSSADERLLQQCIQIGMNRVCNDTKFDENEKSEDFVERRNESDDSYNSADEKLLQDCIKLGMEKTFARGEKELKSDEESLNSSDERLLADCIQLGMTKTFARERKLPMSDEESLNSNDEQLLAECIKLGMEKTFARGKDLIEQKPVSDSPSDERLLADSIKLGMERVSRSQVRREVQNKSDNMNECIGGKNSKELVQTTTRNKMQQQLKRSSSGGGGGPQIINYAPNPKGSERFYQKSTSDDSTKVTAHLTTSFDSLVSLNEAERELLDKCIQAGVCRTIGHQVPQIEPLDDSQLRHDFGAVRPESRKPFGAEKNVDSSKNFKDPPVIVSNVDSEQFQTSCFNRPLNNSPDATKIANSAVQHKDNNAQENARQKQADRIVYQNIGVKLNCDSEHFKNNKKVVEKMKMTNGCNFLDNSVADSRQIVELFSKVPNSSQNFEDSINTSETLKDSVENESSNNQNSKQIEEKLNCDVDETNFQTVGSSKEIKQTICEEANKESENVQHSDEEPSSNSSLDEISKKYDYCKPRDPDSMIASVDRFTVELVSHTSYFQQSTENKLFLTSSLVNDCSKQDDTTSRQDSWNNSVTFPTISATLPESSASSDCKHSDLKDSPDLKLSTMISKTDNELTNAKKSHNLDNCDGASNTKSSPDKMQGSSSSFGSFNLEQVTPPSNIGSLVSLTSMSGQWDAESLPDRNKSTPKLNRKFSFTRSPSVKRKLLQPGVIARRALSNSFSLAYHSLGDYSTNDTFIDNIKPPSAMGNISDMENSMISVASITSEIASERSSCEKIFEKFCERQTSEKNEMRINESNRDARNGGRNCDRVTRNDRRAASSEKNSVIDARIYGKISDNDDKRSSERASSERGSLSYQIYFDTLKSNENYQIYFENEPKSYSEVLTEDQPKSLLGIELDDGSISYVDLEHAPTIFDNVSKISKHFDEEQRTFDHTTCKDFTCNTSEFEDCLTHQIDATLNNADDITEYSDANSLTPLQSDYASSSAESTPKKLTAKERRCVSKDRYKTYTICDVESPKKGDKRNKITPRQRRQEDRDRYQTQVLSESMFEVPKEKFENDGNLLMKHSLSFDKNPENKKNPKSLRELDKDRFRTRTLDEFTSCSPDVSLLPVIDSTETNLSVKQQIKDPKPKITKPKCPDENSDDTKTVRGRRKPLYTNRTLVSPKKIATTVITPPKTQLVSPKKLPNKIVSVQKTLKPPSPNSTPLKTSPKKMMSPQKIAPKPSEVPKKSFNNKKIESTTSPSRTLSKSFCPPKLERQGTFTKSVHVEQKPTVAQIPKTKIPLPSSAIPRFTKKISEGIPKKLPPRSSDSINLPKSPIKSNIPTPKFKKSISDAGPSESATTSKLSNIYQKYRFYGRSLSSDQTKPKSLTVKSTSQSSSVSSNDECVGIGRLRSKEITSRISNIWKRIEVNKKLPPNDNKKLWIRGNNNSSKVSTKLTRSSTFQGGVVFDKSNSDSDYYSLNHIDITTEVNKLTSEYHFLSSSDEVLDQNSLC